MPAARMSASVVNRLSSSRGMAAQTATTIRLSSAPNFSAMPTSRRMGPGRFWPQYWEPRAT